MFLEETAHPNFELLSDTDELKNEDRKTKMLHHFKSQNAHVFIDNRESTGLRRRDLQCIKMKVTITLTVVQRMLTKTGILNFTI